MTSQTIILEHLSAIYQRAMQTQEPKVFFQCLIEYVELFGKHQVLTDVVAEIILECEKQGIHLQELEDLTLQELRGVYKQIKEFVAENHIVDAEIIKELDHFRAIEEGKSRSTTHGVHLRSWSLNDMLHILVKSHLPLALSLVTQFCRIIAVGLPKARLVTDTDLSKTYNEWKNTCAQYERVKLTKVWYSWDQIAFLYNIYTEYEPLLTSYAHEDQFLNMMSLAMKFKEINRMINNGGTTKPRDFDKMEEYRQYMERVHLHTKESLLNLPVISEQVPAVTTQNTKWHYDRDLGKLLINKCELLFKPATFTKDILNAVLCNEDSMKKTWAYDELYESIEGCEVEKFGKTEINKCYEACKGIVQRIANRSGVVQFLIFSKSSLKVNPKYLP